jgi:lysophospholipase L1-like esterase
MQAWEALQKKEGVQLTKKFIKEISPEATLTDDAVEAGNKLVKAFKEQDKLERDALKPYFKEFDEKAVQAIKDPEMVRLKINEALPESGQYVYQTPAGYDIMKYQSSMPFSKEAHGAIKDLLTQLNKPELTLGGLRNIREAMRDKINFLTAPRVSREISGLRKAVMDIIQDEVGTLSNDVQVRDLFKRWAINEENKQIMEQIFGGSINDAATFAKTIKPEDVVNKVFSNTVSVKAAKEILGEKFHDVAANYLSNNMAKFTDAAKNGFSSNKMASLLKAKAPELEEALSQRPEQLAKLRAITDKMRILPDSPSVNTSGTAKTSLYQKMQEMSGYLTEHGLTKVPAQAMKKVMEHFEQAKQTRNINDVLSGKARLDDVAQKRSRYEAFTKIERLGQETAKTINKLSNDIFRFETPVKGLIIEKLTPEETQKKYDKVSKKVREMASNFDNQMNSLETATAPLTGVAPTISASLNMAAARATQFLASKLPPVEDLGPFSQAHKPSSSDIARFNRYYSAVEKPFNILKQMKAGTLTPESMETLKTVYPKLYAEMSNALMDKVTTQINKDNKAVPYKTKIMLSMFFGQDMSNSLKQQNIAETQNILASQNQPKPGQQPKSAFSKLDQSNQALTDMQKTEVS